MSSRMFDRPTVAAGWSGLCVSAVSKSALASYGAFLARDSSPCYDALAVRIK